MLVIAPAAAHDRQASAAASCNRLDSDVDPPASVVGVPTETVVYTSGTPAAGSLGGHRSDVTANTSGNGQTKGSVIDTLYDARTGNRAVETTVTYRNEHHNRRSMALSASESGSNSCGSANDSEATRRSSCGLSSPQRMDGDETERTNSAITAVEDDLVLLQLISSVSALLALAAFIAAFKAYRGTD